MEQSEKSIAKPPLRLECLHLCLSAECSLRLGPPVAYLKAVCLIEHCVYDETPLTLRIRFPGDASEKERAKVFVVELEYAFLLRRTNCLAALPKQDFLLVHIPCSVQIRASENETGENIRNVLLSTSLLPDSEAVHLFRSTIRLAESDEAGANLRAERLLSDARHNAFSCLSTQCSAHKVHAAAKKVMTLAIYGDLCSGVINSLKVLWDRRFMKALKEQLRAHIRSNLVIRHRASVVLSRAAETFRAEALELYAPGPDEPRLRALALYIAGSLLNGDWQRTNLQHICVGPQCCSSPEETMSKIERHILKLARGLKRSMFSRDNWSDWPAQLRFFGFFGSMHAMLRGPFLRALQPGREDAEGHINQNRALADRVENGAAGPVDNLDPVEVERTLRAQSLLKCCKWLETEWEKTLWIMRLCLRPQVRLMQVILKQDSQQHLAASLCMQMDRGQRPHNILALHRGQDTWQMLRDSLRLLQSMELWAHLPQTEELYSHVIMSMTRAAAVVWQQIILRMAQFPYKLFRLLEGGTQQELQQVAADILATPRCQLDDFTESFLHSYNTVDLILSPESIEIVSAIASLIRGSTFSTERLHSCNRRRAFGRVQTTTLDAQTLALPHSGQAIPKWMTVKKKQKCKRTLGRPPKRPRDGAQADQAEPNKRRGGGGPWRAFLHMKASGRQLTPDVVAALSAEYANLSEEEYQPYLALGQAGASSLCFAVHQPVGLLFVLSVRLLHTDSCFRAAGD